MLTLGVFCNFVPFVPYFFSGSSFFQHFLVHFLFFCVLRVRFFFILFRSYKCPPLPILAFFSPQASSFSSLIRGYVSPPTLPPTHCFLKSTLPPPHYLPKLSNGVFEYSLYHGFLVLPSFSGHVTKNFFCLGLISAVVLSSSFFFFPHLPSVFLHLIAARFTPLFLVLNQNIIFSLMCC